MIKYTLLMCLLLLSLTNIVFADIYKWTDEQGTIHFSNAPISIPEDAEKIKENKKPTRTTTEYFEKRYIQRSQVKQIKLPKSETNQIPYPTFIGEGSNKNGEFFITSNFERVKQKPYNYNYKWTTNDGITFYSNRTFEDNEELIGHNIPQQWLPNGKFIRFSPQYTEPDIIVKNELESIPISVKENSVENIEIPTTKIKINTPEPVNSTGLNYLIIIPSIIAFILISLTPFRRLLLFISGLATIAFIANYFIGNLPLPLKIHIGFAGILIVFLELRSLYKFYRTAVTVKEAGA